MGCITGSLVHALVCKIILTRHTKFHTQMVMFILETMVPWVDLEGISAACDNISALPLTVRNIALSVDAFDSCLRTLEATTGLGVGGGTDLSRSSRRNQNRWSSANGIGVNDVGVIVDIP